MTDPIEAPVTEPVPRADPPAAADQPIAVDPPTPPPVPGWVAPDGADGVGLKRGCCLGLAVVIAIVAVMSAMSLAFVYFYDSQTASSLAGTIEFEAGDVTGCFVLEPATAFPAGTTIHTAAHLSRQLSAQERVTVSVTYPDGTSRSTDTFYEDAGDCVSDTIPAGLVPGHWTFEFRTGDEVLATGGFDITP